MKLDKGLEFVSKQYVMYVLWMCLELRDQFKGWQT